MRALIFENEKREVVGAFEGMNLFYFDEQFEFEFKVRSQDLRVFEHITQYDIVYVDIDLAKGSQLDGYSLIEKIQKLEGYPPIVIITGQGDVEKQVEKRQIEGVQILMKPFDFDELYKATTLARKKHNQQVVT